MAKTLQFIVLCVCFLKLWTYVKKGQKQSNKLGDVLKWEREVVSKLQKVLKVKKMLNKLQCKNLVNMLDRVVHSANMMMISIEDASIDFHLVLEELRHITQKVEVLVQECGKEKWCHAAVFQMSNREAFRELVDDLKCLWNGVCEKYLVKYPDSQNDEYGGIDFNVATYAEVKSDERALEGRLEKMLENDEDYELAKHLLRRLQFDLQRVEGAEFDALEVLIVSKPEFVKQIGCGSEGSVFESRWLGLRSVTKILSTSPNFHKEACILACLSHPNVIKFLCCGIFNEGHKINLDGSNDFKRDLILVTEYMDMSLGDFLKKQKTPLPYIVAIYIIYEIARGMCYLHDMHVAHCDLEPNNVLLSIVSKVVEEDENDGYYFVKLIDYALKQKLASKLESTHQIVGTTKYMAPEWYSPLHDANPFQADVWSFAMTCSEILSLKEPYLHSIRGKDVLQKINDNVRPLLPINCEELTMLIEECWVEDPSQRPTFSHICERLAILKMKFLVGTYLDDQPQFDKNGAHSSNMWPWMQQRMNASNHINMFAPNNVDERTHDEVVIGLESKLAQMRSHLKQVNILGLIGMGGIGKTTLARALFEDVRSTYDISCFIENMKSRSSHKILCEILQNSRRAKETDRVLVDTQKRMRELLATKKVLLILDDPLDANQVHDIVPTNVPYINNGTKIVITTRSWRIIESFVDGNGRIDVGALDGNAAKKLFNSYAFQEEADCPTNFVLRDKIIEACNGLPLSLRVMGAYLRGKKRIRSWERALQRMTKGRLSHGDEGLWRTLHISFDELQENEKDLFLDIACLFPKGLRKEKALHLCTNYDTSPALVLDTLVIKSLLKIDDEGFLEMHDQLRDMGRMIVETNKEYLGTRIWNPSTIPLWNESSEHVKKVEAIYLNDQSLQWLLENRAGIKDLDASSLRLLICSRLTTLPEGLENLTSLTMLCVFACWSLTTLPMEVQYLTSLTSLDLINCSRLTDLPEGLGKLSSLRALDLSGCWSLTTLPKGVGNLSSLTTMDLSGCSSLETLPEEVGSLSSLTTIALSDCSTLKTLPTKLGSLISLTNFNLSKCSSLVTLPEGLGNLTLLTTLDLSKCSSLENLPEELGRLISLTILDLSDCWSLIELPDGIGNLTSLKTFDLSRCWRLTSLPERLGNLASLRTLNLSECTGLNKLLEGLGELSCLITMNLSECSTLKTLPDGLEKLTSLETFDLSRGWSLTTLPEGLGKLISLTTLHLCECRSLETLPNGLGKLSSLATLDLSKCASLAMLPEELGNLTSLTTLDMSKCLGLNKLPERLGELSSLRTLDLSECARLQTLPNGIGNLTSLTTFDLSRCWKLTTLPEGLGNLTSLTTLDLSKCVGLNKLPESLGELSSLRTLDLSECTRLQTLPNGIGNLISLTTFDLSRCWKLTTLPEGLGNLTSLTTLDLSKCVGLNKLPESLGGLSSLTTLNLSGCLGLNTLPKTLGEVSSLTTLDLSVL